MTKPRVAVITDSMSSGFYFPIWYKYYASQFGWESINLLTLPGMAQNFSGYRMASIQEMDSSYNDDVRLSMVTSKVSDLLETNDIVIRVDADEILVPDPISCPSLSDYVYNMTVPFVTARGFDVIQTTGEAPLKFDEPILVHQRSVAFALNAMNKTCITKVPLTWSRGFHYCNERPNLDSLFLFHLKRADIETLVSWNRHVSSMIVNDDFIKAYYETPAEKVAKFHHDFSARKIDEGPMTLYRDEFYSQYLAVMRQDPRTGVFGSKNEVESVNVKIPERFRGTI